MKISKNREHTINMGQYESLKIGASIEVEVDLPEGSDPTPLYDLLDVGLTKALESQVKEAIELLPNGSSSYILSWVGHKDA